MRITLNPYAATPDLTDTLKLKLLKYIYLRVCVVKHCQMLNPAIIVREL